MTPSPHKSGRGRRPRSRSRGPRKTEPAEALHPTAEPPDISSFEHWDLGDSIQAAIRGMGIESPTPIQALAIGPVLEGRDVIAKAETGTGKTLAFGAPMMARMDPQRSSVLALVLCPTRELSEQVFQVLQELGEASDLSVALIVGGEDMRPQVEALHAGAQVVVGTPGRVLDLMNQRFLSFPWTEFAVLDEADKMLEIGFIDDVKKILAAIPDERQTLLFSATFPPPLLALARGSTRDPAEIATAKGVATVDTISQYFISVDEDRRPRALSRMINASDPDDVFLVFCERRTDVDRLLRWMERERFPVKALHGGYDQASRFRVMSAFRDGDVKALLATDVASRGLDVNHVSHVVNFAVPRDISDYTHRIGRTGRAGRTGTAVTLVTPADRRNWGSLLRGATWDVEELDDPADIFRPRREKPAGGEGAGRERSRRSGRDSDRERSRESDRDSRRERSRDRDRDEGRDRDRDRDRDRGRADRDRDGRRKPEQDRGDGRERRPGRDGSSDERRGSSRPRRREREAEGREKPRRSREDSPRDSAPAKEEKTSTTRAGSKAGTSRAGAGGFGSGIFDAGRDEKKDTSKKRERPPRKRAKERSGADSERPTRTKDHGNSGFGAGL